MRRSTSAMQLFSGNSLPISTPFDPGSKIVANIIAEELK